MHGSEAKAMRRPGGDTRSRCRAVRPQLLGTTGLTLEGVRADPRASFPAGSLCPRGGGLSLCTPWTLHRGLVVALLLALREEYLTPGLQPSFGQMALKKLYTETSTVKKLE